MHSFYLKNYCLMTPTFQMTTEDQASTHLQCFSLVMMSAPIAQKAAQCFFLTP